MRDSGGEQTGWDLMRFQREGARPGGGDDPVGFPPSSCWVSSKVQEYLTEEWVESVRARGSDECKEADSYTCELMTFVIACRRPTKFKTDKTPAWRQERDMQFHP